MKIIDKIGQPRSNEEILDAIKCVLDIMVKQPLVLPNLTVHAAIIRDGLIELLQRRTER